MAYDKDQIIQVTNRSRGACGFVSEVSRRKRRWDRPGIVRGIPFAEIEDMVLSTGGYRLFSEFLLVLDEGVREELGLPNDKMSIMSIEDIQKCISGNITTLKAVLESANRTLLNTISSQAIAMKIDSMEKLKLIEQYSGIKMVQISQELAKQAPTSTVEKKMTAIPKK